MKRKIIWMVVSCLMVASLVLTSCAEAVTEEEEEVVTEEEEVVVVEEEEEGPKYGGTLRVAYTPDLFTFDPPLMTGAADIIVVHQAYESLVERNPDWTLRPLLAESWESNDELTQWTFLLHQGVKFIHGKELKRRMWSIPSIDCSK